MKTPSYSRSVRALAWFTRESVNRVKLRESGGLNLFVRILEGRCRFWEFPFRPF
jgi:hypothetical protein